MKTIKPAQPELYPEVSPERGERSIEGVGQTAFIIAYWRVAETESVNPLFSDHLAHLFLIEETRQMAEAITRTSPSTRHLISFRTRYFDDRLQQAMDQGVRQVVLLGAGLDTRPLRLARPEVHFFEIDQKKLFNYKRAQLISYGYELNSTMLDCNYVEEDWLARLLAAGLKPEQPIYLIWEGNSMYIPEPAIRHLLETMRRDLSHVTLSFDYLSPNLIRGATARPQALLAGFQALQAPWITGLADISGLAAEAGLAVTDNILLSELGRHYKPELNLAVQLLDGYFICTLTSDGMESK